MYSVKKRHLAANFTSTFVHFSWNPPTDNQTFLSLAIALYSVKIGPLKGSDNSLDSSKLVPIKSQPSGRKII